MKKKIGLFLDGSPHEGGSFQYNQTMIDAVAALAGERFEVVFGYTSSHWVPYLPAGLPARSVSTGVWGRALSVAWTRVGLPMGPWRALSPLFHPIAKALIAERCDLWIFPSPTGKSFQVPVPALVTIHDLMHRYERRFPESGSGWEFYGRERNLANICRWSRGVLVDSSCGREQVRECYGMAPEKIHVLPYIAPRYIHETEAPEGFADRYRLPAKFLFYPAQFWEHKNHKRLIEAMSLLKHELPDLKLVLAGSKKNGYDGVVDLVRDRGMTDDVIFLGYVPDADIAQLYRRARALVMPTFYGPTNIPPLEAFAAGCPVAISGIYGMHEQCGDAALFFDPRSVEEIAACIKRLWTDDGLCAELHERGRKRTESWGQKQFNERLREIVGFLISPL